MCETTRECVSSREPNDDYPAQPGNDGTPLSEYGHPHRERLIQHLRGRDAPVHLADLARELTRQVTSDGGERRGIKTDADSIYAMLYHDHVPRLADAGVVEFDRKEKTVRLMSQSDPDRVPAD